MFHIETEHVVVEQPLETVLCCEASDTNCNNCLQRQHTGTWGEVFVCFRFRCPVFVFIRKAFRLIVLALGWWAELFYTDTPLSRDLNAAPSVRKLLSALLCAFRETQFADTWVTFSTLSFPRVVSVLMNCSKDSLGRNCSIWMNMCGIRILRKADGSEEWLRGRWSRSHEE
jgi:hypothetical protein